MIIVIDFDGTVVTHDYPFIGKDIGAVPILKKLIDKDHKLILFTMRSGQYLSDAVNWFKENDIPLWGVNENPQQKEWTDSPKVYGQLYIDDAALGCPLDPIHHSRPFVDWREVKYMLKGMGII